MRYRAPYATISSEDNASEKIGAAPLLRHASYCSPEELRTQYRIFVFLNDFIPHVHIGR